jgi:hypothetical protein
VQHYEPPPFLSSNAEEEEVLRQAEISMLEKHIIEPALVPGFVSRFVPIPKPHSTELRPILNLRRFNRFVSTCHFKMETLKTAMTLLQTGWWMSKTDIKDAFFTIPLHSDFRPFFQFRLLETKYQFKCLPQGYVLSPFLFTRALKAVLKPLRTAGMILVAYLDDILLIAPTKATCLYHTSILR